MCLEFPTERLHTTQILRATLTSFVTTLPLVAASIYREKCESHHYRPIEVCMIDGIPWKCESSPNTYRYTNTTIIIVLQKKQIDAHIF